MILRKYFVSMNINGKNNKILFLKNKKEYPMLFKHGNSSIKILGNNNIIKFCYDIRNFPKGLYVKIVGDNNYIEIHKCSFKNTNIGISESNNTFIISEQDVHSLSNCTIWQGRGSTIQIGKNCELDNGNLYIVVNGDYKNKHKLVIGDGVHIAKDVLIRTSDGQVLIDPETGLPTDEPQDVIIENDVWIMSRCIILKGSFISEGSAVAANSLVNKKFTEPNVLIAGTPAKILKHNIRWAKYSYGSYMEMLESKNSK